VTIILKNLNINFRIKFDKDIENIIKKFYNYKISIDKEYITPPIHTNNTNNKQLVKKRGYEEI
jgi:hypothetical protein